jgi:tetratricopeptide (TPR) repeat protein
MIHFFQRLNRAVRHVFARMGEGLANLGAAIVAPIERAFAATFGRLFRVAERFERIEDWLLALLRVLTWPIRMLWRLLAAVGLALVPASVRASVSERVEGSGRLLERIGAAAWRQIERLNLDAPVRWLAWLLQPAWRPLAAVGGFFYAWAATRPYRQMVWGMPALLMLVPVGAAVTWGMTWGKESVEAQYRAAVKDAREADEYDKVLFFERKLAQLGADTQNADYKSALALEEAGKLDLAFERMQQLAPEKSVGYPPAHNWIFVKLISGALQVPEEDRLRMAGAHLDRLQTLGAKGPDVDLMRAIWLSQNKRFEEAADLLEPHVSLRPMAALQRMEFNLRLERLEDARNDARAVRTHLRQALVRAQRDGTKLDAGLFPSWAQAEQLIGEAPEFNRVVRMWLEADPKNVTARQAVAVVDAHEFDEILHAPVPDPDALAKKLSELAQLVENPTSLEPQVAALYRSRKQSPPLAAMIDQLIAAETTPLPLVSAIGTAAALEGDIPLARTLLARVVSADESNAVAWNNYAWALTQDPEKNLEQALEAVNHALQLTPQEFRFRETRGQILTALGRWQDAVDDLEFALNGMPDVPAIHISLAQAYDALGQAELAAIHRQQVP